MKNRLIGMAVAAGLAVTGAAVVAPQPASAGVLCSKAHICPVVYNSKKKSNWGRIVMFDHIDQYGSPYGTQRNLWPGQWSYKVMRDPDFFMPVGEGGRAGCLWRSDEGRDTNYGKNGKKIRDNERHFFYVKPCS